MIQGLESTAVFNLIIEGASDQINTVVLAIADAALPTHRADWLERYRPIEDLNVLTATKSGAADADHLERSPEFTDRYPMVAFFIDAVRPNLDRAEEHFMASLGVHIEVQGETFAIAQREIHEIHRCIRNIMLLDKSFGEITSRGGIVDLVRFSHFEEPEFLKDDMQKHIILINYYYAVYFKEKVYR